MRETVLKVNLLTLQFQLVFSINLALNPSLQGCPLLDLNFSLFEPSAGVDPGIQLRGAMASTLCEPITGSGGRAPSGFKGRSPGQGVRGRSLPEAERRSLYRCPKEGEIWPIGEDFWVVLKLVQQSKCFFSIGTRHRKWVDHLKAVTVCRDHG